MRVAFETFVFDTAQRQLEQGGVPVHLSPKAFQLLEILVEAAPSAVSREEIYDTLWGDTFVVDANLPNLVSEIRSVLDDSAREPRFVRTVHRHGYAFIGSLRDVSSSPSRFVVDWASKSFPLNEGINILGRDESASIRIESAGVSRMHAAITIAGGEATVQDRGSKNGTFVGHTRAVEPTPVSSGDIIRLGSVRVTFRARPRSDSTLTEFSSTFEGKDPAGKT